MKKFILRVFLLWALVLMSFSSCPRAAQAQEAFGSFTPAYTNSLSHFGIGAARVTNYIAVYEKPDTNSKILQRIYWNNADTVLILNKEGIEGASDIFLSYRPNKNMVFLSVEDEEDNWLKVCYNQKKRLFGWVKKIKGTDGEIEKNGAKFYPYPEFFFKYGKKYGIYTFKNLPADFKKLHARPNQDSDVVDEFDVAKHITPWLIQGNWMLVKLTTYDNKTKTGWLRWRSDTGHLTGFIDFE